MVVSDISWSQLNVAMGYTSNSQYAGVMIIRFPYLTGYHDEGREETELYGLQRENVQLI